ncbi:MAG: DUF4359 domain-containing protein [Cyanothece sp. SIO1E1]|nr:DUF4359 domain-containing protein [Cyanothece sp. SIO1E1]
MKLLKIVFLSSSVATLVVGTALFITNPETSDYEEYAVQSLTTYLKAKVCPQAPSFLGNSLEAQCASLIDSNQSEIQRLISNGTKRENFVFFSIYQTNLSVASFIPSYEFETVGVLQKFYTYKTEEQ